MLNGNLDTFALPDVLRFIASGRVTGRVEITREDVVGELTVDQGQFVGASLADEDAPTTVDEALDVAVLLFDGSGGTFDVVQEEWVGGPLNLTADELAKAVERRRKEWAAVVEQLGSLDEPLVIAAGLPDGIEQVTIRADQWQLLSFVDGRRSVQDVASDSGSTVYATAVALAEMANAGMLARGHTDWDEQPSPKRAKKTAEPDATEALHDLAEEAEDEGPEEPAPPARRSSVRSLRAPTREEQRIRLRR
jgi:hypothetical protein